MSDHFKATINDLQKILAEHEDAARNTKNLINQLSEVFGRPPVYTDMVDNNSAGGTASSGSRVKQLPPFI
ncbi:MAG TPA: hypothetical protein PLF22_05410 [Pseudomonadales bacterium]|nr:hypothetical protein [Pseudomonadales bacterium]